MCGLDVLPTVLLADGHGGMADLSIAYMIAVSRFCLSHSVHAMYWMAGVNKEDSHERCRPRLSSLPPSLQCLGTSQFEVYTCCKLPSIRHRITQTSV